MVNPFTGNRFKNNDHSLVQFLLDLVFVFIFIFIWPLEIGYAVPCQFKACFSLEFLCLQPEPEGGGRGLGVGGSVTWGTSK